MSSRSRLTIAAVATASLLAALPAAAAMRSEVSKALIGQREVVDNVLCALLALLLYGLTTRGSGRQIDQSLADGDHVGRDPAGRENHQSTGRARGTRRHRVATPICRESCRSNGLPSKRP